MYLFLVLVGIVTGKFWSSVFGLVWPNWSTDWSLFTVIMIMSLGMYTWWKTRYVMYNLYIC